MAGADWVIEAAPERLELKQELFESIDRAAPPAAVLATNTSVIRPSEIAARARHRERILGTHWWSPPYLVPLVEVVQTVETDPQVVDRTMALLEALGKTPVHVRRDVAGFVGNRLQHAMWREAFALLDAGVCDAETIDLVVRTSFGRRLEALGPIENADLIGLDLTLDIHRYIAPRLDPPSEPSAGLRERVARGDWAQDRPGLPDLARVAGRRRECPCASEAREGPGAVSDHAIITAALTGPIATKADNPALPTTPEEIAAAAREAYEAGAAIVHVHLRDAEGRPTADLDIARRVLAMIEESCPALSSSQPAWAWTSTTRTA